MYNHLVTSDKGAWDLPTYKWDYNRIRLSKYTAESLKARFAELNTAALEELKSLPTLFTYEGDDEPVRVGYIRRIQKQRYSLLIEYEFDESIAAFTYSALKPLEAKLGIQSRWERWQAHWAVKDEDLFELLSLIGLVDPSYVGEGRPPGRVEEMRFKVALSFPGEKREYVADVASEVKKHLGRDAVFYDMDFTAQLARPNLDTLLQRIYLDNSDLVVVFLCADYENKEWCGLECRAIREKIKSKNDHALRQCRRSWFLFCRRVRGP